MILAALTLLSMSLNAQLKTTKNGVVVQPNTSIEKVDTPPDGYFRMGPSRASTTPVTPPYSNDFGSSTLWNWWEVINANNDGSNYTWALSSNTARYRYNSSRAADDWLVTAPVTLEAGKTYKFYIDTWAQSSGYPEKLEVKLASGHTATALSNGTTIIGQTTVTASSSSPLHLSNENITVNTSGNYYIGIHAISDADMYYLFVDNFVIDVAASVHDLSIALSAPANVGAGGTATLTATVTNTGNYAESGYTVTFRDGNNNVIDTQTGGTLAVRASTTFTTTYTTTAAQAGQTVNFTATVTCNGDEDATNNNAMASTSVITLPPPENVAVTAGENQTATVTWDEPSNLPKLVSGTVTEDFEDTDVFPPYSVGGITATQHTGAFGDWTLYDPSGANVFGDQNLTWENEGAPHAWQVFPASTFSMNAHSGDQFMLSIDCVTSGGNTNHWLISPELTGEAQTISFYAAEITTSYGAETYEIWVSTTDNNPASFSQLGNSHSVSTTSWASQSISLPAGTKYFAIRHTSYDIYGMMIDDVTYKGYIPTPPDSYNIYLDGVLVGNVSSNSALSYTFNNLTSGQHVCAVSAVYPGGMESEQVSAIIPSFEPFTDGTVSPNSVDFGTKNIGGTYTATVTITNTGNQPFTPTIDVTNLPQGITVSPTTSGALAPNGTLDLTVTFSPTAETSYSGSFTVTIPVPDDDDIVVTVTVTGTGYYGNRVTSNTTEVIPVYKSDIEMGAPYTKDQVDDDDMMMELIPNIATGTLNVKVKNESAIKRYEINRGLPSNWSVVAIAGHQGNYFTPYDGDGVTAQGDAVDVSSAGTDYTWVTVQDNTSAPSGTAYYVPVTVADGKVRTGNTYGAKRLPITVALGSVSATVEVDQGGENEGSTWEINGVEYCVYIPVFEIAGTLPNVTVDGVTYEPYMFRAWRKGSGAYEVTRDYNDPLKPLKEGAPLGPVSLLAQRTNVNSTSVTIGDQYDEESPDDKPETAFAAPYVQDPDISFVVRFYYKRVIDNGESPAGMRRSPVEEGEYYIAEYELEDTDVSIVTAINELFNGRVAVETTYVNALGQQSSQPFDGVNIVITRYNDGTVTTSKVLK